MFSLCIPAFAADPTDKYVVGHVFTQEEVDRFWNDHTAQPYVSIESTVKLNRNTTGFQGTGCGYFTADAQTVTFVITNAPGASTYNVGLLQTSQTRHFRANQEGRRYKCSRQGHL